MASNPNLWTRAMCHRSPMRLIHLLCQFTQQGSGTYSAPPRLRVDFKLLEVLHIHNDATIRVAVISI